MKDIIQKKLDQYRSKTEEEEENALKEITQEVALYALSKSGFFESASFQGGTCLRIIYGLERFSEDLDFVLNAPTPHFDLIPYLQQTANMDQTWLLKQLEEKIQEIKWPAAAQDVSPFLKPEDEKNVRKLWSKEFFYQSC